MRSRPAASRLPWLACGLLAPALLLASAGCGGRTPLSGPGQGFVPIDDGGPGDDTGPVPDVEMPPDVEFPDFTSGDALITDDFGPFDASVDRPFPTDGGAPGPAGFSNPVYVPTGGGSSAFVAVGDFDGDGHLNLAVVHALDGILAILGGRGDGSFETRLRIPLDPGIMWAVVADVNGDGRPDLLVGPGTVGGFSGGSIVVLLNDGSGNFDEGIPLRTPAPAYGAVAGDFDGNGTVNLMAICPASQSLAFLPGRGDGRFQRYSEFPVGGFPAGLASGAFSDDGVADVVYADQERSWVGVLYGESGGPTQRDTLIGTGATPTGVAMARLAGSDLDDVAVTNLIDGTVSVIRGRARPGEPPFGRVDLQVGGQPVFVTSGDFDADGIVDLMVVDQEPGRLVLVRGLGDLSFAPSIPFGIPGSFLTMVAVGDFNEDGLPDLVAPDFEQGIHVLLNAR